VAAAVVLALGSTSALAVEGAGNSSLIVNVYDGALGISIVKDLGLNYANFLEADVTPTSGLQLDFNVDLSIFAGSNPSNIRWSVYASDSQGLFGATEMLTTAALDLGTMPGTNSSVTGSFGSSGMAAVFTQWNNTCGTSAETCTGTGFSSTYFGEYGEDYNNFLLVPASGALDAALGFYSLRRSSNGGQDPLISAQYTNGNLAQWLLNSDGTLTYSVAPVPLPAALWLLLSGLAGVGVIGRRKTVA
jgi:hypothetical protein